MGPSKGFKALPRPLKDLLRRKFIRTDRKSADGLPMAGARDGRGDEEASPADGFLPASCSGDRDMFKDVAVAFPADEKT